METLDGFACQSIPISIDGSTDRGRLIGRLGDGTTRAKPHRWHAIAAPRVEKRTHAGPRHIGQFVLIFMAQRVARFGPFTVARVYASTVRRFDGSPVQGLAYPPPVFLTGAREKPEALKGSGGCHRYTHAHRATYQGCLSCLTCRPVHRFAVALPIKGGIVYDTRNPSWSQYLNCELSRPAFRRLLRTRGEY